jgi:hypothetical protein
MRRLITLLAALSLLVPAGAASAADRGTYTNPVSAGFADTFADPHVIRGHDGYWYAFGTSDPLREGEREPRRIPIARSTDLVSWTYVRDAFDAGQLPRYAATTSALWAPDVRYLGGRWVMYMTVTDTTVSDDDTFDTAVGVATAPSPTGPWTFAPDPVVAPRPGPGGGYLWTIDPAQLNAPDGRRYLYYGSYYGGIVVTELTADGLRATGTSTMVAIDNKYEGSFVLHRDGWYYLFASSANCCAGPTTGYSVSVGRSRDPRGPFVDRDGLRLDVSRAGGTTVIAPNGNRWIGTGHNSVITDLSGQDWLVYHAIDPADPYLNEPFGINERPMLIDRLDWGSAFSPVKGGGGAEDGWPTVRAGRWASEKATAAPVTTGLARRVGHADVRVEADVRGATAGLRIGAVTVRLDGAALVVRVGQREIARTALPAAVDVADWHNLAVELRDGRLTAELSQSRLRDPWAVISARVPHGGGPVAVIGAAEFANLSVAPLYRPVREAAPVPVATRPLPAYSDEFTGGLDADWTWVRPDPAATVAGGTLNWPVQAADLTGPGGNAGVLLRDAPPGDYIAETKVTLDLGEDVVRNFQQAGLIAYVGDDDFARLSTVAIWNTRQVEFGREIPYAGQTSYGGTIPGTPGLTTTWLRLAHRIDPATGEHEYRAGVSRDGRNWAWGGVWTFPAGTTPRIGLIAHGAQAGTPPVTAEFDYLRFFGYGRS